MERKEREDRKENNIIIKGMKRKKWERKKWKNLLEKRSRSKRK